MTAPHSQSEKKTSSASRNTLFNRVYRNLPNMVSILGVLPLCMLLLEDGFVYLGVLIVLNNIADDLDGLLAKKLKLGSSFGADLDNVSDAVAHILITMVVGAHYGGIVLACSMLASTAILIRVTQRVAPSSASSTGTPTNELMRHLLLLSILHGLYGFDITIYLIAVFVLHAVSMLVPFAMPHLVRCRARSASAVLGVNIALVLAWWVPSTASFIAMVFFSTYLYSFVAGGIAELTKTKVHTK